jgi:hypothetical protein
MQEKKQLQEVKLIKALKSAHAQALDNLQSVFNRQHPEAIVSGANASDSKRAIMVQFEQS